MKNNVIKFTVNPFTSLENIMKKVNSAAEGKIIDGIFTERKSFFKTEVEILLSAPQPIYIDKPSIREVIKEVPVEVIKEVFVPTSKVDKPSNKKEPVVKYKENATSKYRGVVKNRNRYEVSIMHKGKRHFVGSFISELDAARAYNKAAIELKGDKAVLNRIDIDQEVTA